MFENIWKVFIRVVAVLCSLIIKLCRKGILHYIMPRNSMKM